MLMVSTFPLLSGLVSGLLVSHFEKVMTETGKEFQENSHTLGVISFSHVIVEAQDKKQNKNAME